MSQPEDIYSDWYHYTVLPVRAGWYQIENARRLGSYVDSLGAPTFPYPIESSVTYRYWDGENWMWLSDYDGKAEWLVAAMFSRWRGLRETFQFKPQAEKPIWAQCRDQAVDDQMQKMYDAFGMPR